MKIKDILNRRAEVAFEFFPPKTEQGEENLFQNMLQLESIQPAYVSVTYGAGGSSRDNTKRVVLRIAREEKLTVMAHLTCIGHSKEEITSIIDEYKDAKIENIMALRGDSPRDGSITVGDGDFPHAIDLIRFIRERYGDVFSIGGAAFPEIHPESSDLDFDMRYFKEKANSGMDFAVSQMFFDNKHYYQLVDRAEQWGIDIPIVPGIMPITNYQQIKRFAQLSNAKIPIHLVRMLEQFQNDEKAVYDIGVEHAVKQCEDLITNGFRFFHFFTLNKSGATLEIYHTLHGNL